VIPDPTPTDSAAAPPRDPGRIVSFRLRSVLSVLAMILALLVCVAFIFVAHHALELIVIALFFALALNPVVRFFEHRGLGRRLAVGAVFTLAVALAVLLGLVFIPPLVREVTLFVNALPGLVPEITHGRGALGRLATRFHVVQHLQAVTTGGQGGVGAAKPVLRAASSVLGTVVGVVVVAFLTLFMLIEGREWRARVLELLPAASQPRWQRIGTGIYQAVGGFVAGNLLASLLAGLVALVAMLVFGLPFAVPVALLVVLLELVPYVGPVLTTVLLAALGLVNSALVAFVIGGFFVLYHAIEGHTLRPMLYGRALKLSTLTVLIALVIGIETAGILGALAAIPLAGAIQVIVDELLLERRLARGAERPAAEPVATVEVATLPPEGPTRAAIR